MPGRDRPRYLRSGQRLPDIRASRSWRTGIGGLPSRRATRPCRGVRLHPRARTSPRRYRFVSPCASSTGTGPRCNAASVAGQRAAHHPVDAEAVGAHAEIGAPERGREPFRQHSIDRARDHELGYRKGRPWPASRSGTGLFAFAFVQPSLRPFWIHSPSLRGTMRPPRGWRRTARGRGLWARLPRGPKRASRRRRNVFIRMFHPSHRKSAPTLASRRARRRRRYLNTVDSQGHREQSFLHLSGSPTVQHAPWEHAAGTRPVEHWQPCRFARKRGYK